MGGTVLVTAAVVGIVAATSGAAPAPDPKATVQPSRAPADALDSGSVPDVTALAGKAGPAGKVTFRWTNPQPKPGDTYKWRIHSLTADGPFQAAAAPHAEVAAGTDGPRCIQVMIVRRDGASSPLGDGSIACAGTK